MITRTWRFAAMVALGTLCTEALQAQTTAAPGWTFPGAAQPEVTSLVAPPTNPDFMLARVSRDSALPVLALAAATEGTNARDHVVAAESWVYLGPQRATVKRLVLSPADPERMLAVVDMRGMYPMTSSYYESDSAGAVWKLDTLRAGGTLDATFDTQGRTIATGYGGLVYREAGSTAWLLGSHPQYGSALISEHVAVGVGVDAPVWVSGRVPLARRLFRLSNDLQTWTDVTPELPEYMSSLEMALSDAQPGRVAVATIGSASNTLRVYVSHDDGASWTAGDQPPEMTTVTTVRWVGDRLFVGGLSPVSGRAQLWSSSDNGASWELTLHSTSIEQAAIDVAGDAARLDVLWVGAGEGVYRSSDGGKTFDAPLPGSVQGVWRLVHEPLRNQLWAGLQDEGVSVSSDGGVTWEARNERLGALPSMDVASNPLNPVEVASMGSGNYVPYAQVATSTSGGLEWTANLAPFARGGRAVRFGPSGRLFATVRDADGGTVWRRDTNGEWQQIGFEWPTGSTLEMDDLNFGISEDTVLVSARLAGPIGLVHRLWRSPDGGQTWEVVLNGVSNTEFKRIERTQGPQGMRLFVMESPQGPSSGIPARLWASDDDGESWFNTTDTLPQGYQQLSCVGDGGEVVVVQRDVWTYAHRIFRSADAGNTWTQGSWVPAPDFSPTKFYAMHCPGDAQRVFLGGGSGDLWMVADGGTGMHTRLASEATWGEIPVVAIHLSPLGLYVSNRSGVWVNPDITPPEGPPTGLTVTRTDARMRYRVTLAWDGGSEQVDIYRNGEFLEAVGNSGSWSQQRLASGNTEQWQVCNAGSSHCTASVPTGR